MTAAASLFLSLLVWHGASEIAAGGGERGPWQQNESRYDYVDDPTVAIDARGRTRVAWVDQAKKDVFLGEVNVSRSPTTFSWLPRLALAPDNPDAVYLLWQEIIFSGGSHGGDILFARSTDGGASFSAPLNLSASVAGDGKGRVTPELWHNGSLDLAAGPQASLYAAWTEYEGALWFMRSEDGGRSFLPKLRINPGAARPARGPSLAIAPDGSVYLAWTDGDVYVAKSADGGKSFAEPRRITKSPPYSDAPKVAVGPEGNVHLVYAEGRRIRYARNLEKPRPISGANGGFPYLETDAAGRVYVMWEAFPERASRPRGLAMAISADRGATFSDPARVPHSADPHGAPNGSFQGLLMDKLAVGPGGKVAVVNSSFAEGLRSRIWLLTASPPP